VKKIDTISTKVSASGIEVTSAAARIVNAVTAMNALTMKMSPWAKLIMPMMPYTIV
jgi:hypothetical protein